MVRTLRRLKVNSTPPRRLRRIIGDTSLTIPDAIAELVANSLDARSSDEQRVNVEVWLGPEEVRVLDDALGMTLDVLQEAIRLGVDMDKVIRNGRTRMGYFGLGMKTACASMGNWWSIVTRPIAQNEELVVEFDLERDQEDTEALWQEEVIVREPTSDSPLGTRPCGTAIIITRLHRGKLQIQPQPGAKKKTNLCTVVARKLSEAFKGYLKQGDTITVIRTESGDEFPCEPVEPPLFPGSRVSFSIPFSESDTIHGWLALARTVRARPTERGFNIYRRGQLIKSSSYDFGFHFHPTISYLLGDLHLDFLRANFFKKGLHEESRDWVKAVQIISKFLAPAVSAARAIKSNMSPSQLNETLQKMRERLRELADDVGAEVIFEDQAKSGRPTNGLEEEQHTDSDDLGNDVEGPIGPNDELVGADGPPSTPPIRVSLKSLTLEDGQTIALDFAEEALETEVTPWSYISPPGGDEILAVTNTKSELYQQLKEPRLVLALAVSDAILQFLMKEKGKSLSEARAVRDEWLHKFLKSEEVRL